MPPITNYHLRHRTIGQDAAIAADAVLLVDALARSHQPGEPDAVYAAVVQAAALLHKLQETVAAQYSVAPANTKQQMMQDLWLRFLDERRDGTDIDTLVKDVDVETLVWLNSDLGREWLTRAAHLLGIRVGRIGTLG